MFNAAGKLITRLATYAIENPASFLKRTAAVNFSMGSVGLIIGMIINNKIPKKEKRFMIVQEATEGVLDLGVFLGCATAFEKLGRWMVQTKKLVPHIKDLSKTQVKDAITKFFLNPKNPQGISIAAESAIRNWVKCAEVGAGLVGTILAFNIVTPLIRNFCASHIERLLGKKLDKSQTYSPILPAQKLNVVSGYDKQNPFAIFENSTKTGKLPQHAYATVKPAFTGSGMRV